MLLLWKKVRNVTLAALFLCQSNSSILHNHINVLTQLLTANNINSHTSIHNIVWGSLNNPDLGMSDSGVLSGYHWSLLGPGMLQRGVLAACRSLLGPRDCAGGPTISPVVCSLLLLELDYQGTKTNGTRTNFQKNKRRQIIHCIVNNKVFILSVFKKWVSSYWVKAGKQKRIWIQT